MSIVQKIHYFNTGPDPTRPAGRPDPWTTSGIGTHILRTTTRTICKIYNKNKTEKRRMKYSNHYLNKKAQLSLTTREMRRRNSAASACDM